MDDQKIRQSVRDFYNQNSDYWSTTRQTWWSDLVFIKDHLAAGGKLLDFGCGNGRLLELIGSLQKSDQKKIDYTGVDISEELLAHAQARYPQHRFELIDGEDQLPFTDESFDVIVSIAVFHHLAPEMAEKALKELQRILKPQGKLILTCWYLWRGRYLDQYHKQKAGQAEENRNIFLSFDQKKANPEEGRFCYFWKLEELVELVEKTGFSINKKGITLGYKGEKRNYYILAEKK